MIWWCNNPRRSCFDNNSVNCDWSGHEHRFKSRIWDLKQWLVSHEVYICMLLWSITSLVVCCHYTHSLPFGCERRFGDWCVPTFIQRHELHHAYYDAYLQKYVVVTQWSNGWLPPGMWFVEDLFYLNETMEVEERKCELFYLQKSCGIIIYYPILYSRINKIQLHVQRSCFATLYTCCTSKFICKYMLESRLYIHWELRFEQCKWSDPREVRMCKIGMLCIHTTYVG